MGEFLQSQVFPNGKRLENIYSKNVLIPFTERPLK